VLGPPTSRSVREGGRGKKKREKGRVSPVPVGKGKERSQKGRRKKEEGGGGGGKKGSSIRPFPVSQCHRYGEKSAVKGKKRGGGAVPYVFLQEEPGRGSPGQGGGKKKKAGKKKGGHSAFHLARKSIGEEKGRGKGDGSFL